MFVVWERVIPTDWAAPTSLVLSRLADPRVSQYWDRQRLVSQQLGERKGESETIVWDWIAIYPPGVQWYDGRPPEPVYQGRPVVSVADEFRQRLSAVMAAR